MDVSRETMESLETFQQLLLKWTPKINLVSKASVGEAWERHIVDSLQLVPLIKDANHVVDLGSGGGLPAIPLAIATKSKGTRFTLVESDKRKSEFLRTVIRALSLNATVITERIENTRPLEADLITARALAPCVKLFAYSERHLKLSGTALLLKGETYAEELEDAQAQWTFSLVEHPSTTSSKARILEVQDLRRV